MSHTTTIKTVPIKNMSALQAAVRDLQKEGIAIELKEGGTPRMFFANQFVNDTGKAQADYVLHLKNSYYDIGLVKDEQGSYNPVFDDYPTPGSDPRSVTPEARASIRDLLGTGGADVSYRDPDYHTYAMGKFLQAYSKNAAIMAAMAEGYFVESCTVDNKGKVQLLLGGMD